MLLQFPNERTEFSDAGYSALGRALTYATAFEAVCRSLSSLKHVKCRVPELQKISPEGSDVFAIAIGEIWDQRLRQHIKKISDQQGWYFTSDIAVTLAKAREARNQIAHEAALSLPSRIEIGVDCSQFLARIALLIEDISVGFMIVELTSLIETQEPIPTFDFFANYSQRIVQWVTADIQANPTLAVSERWAGEEQEFEIAPGAKIVMCWIPPGEFLMGSPENELGHSENEMQNRVKITQGFWLGKYPVTQGQWEAVMGSNPSHFKGSDLPVERVSLKDVLALSWMNESIREGFLEKINPFPEEIFYLPTWAQWEYACRAGTTSALNNGRNLTSVNEACPNLDEVAWYYENSENTTHPVGQKRGNAWGLHDMHGNVVEWCMDWLGADTNEPLADPRGPGLYDLRQLRGGGFDCRAEMCRAAFLDHRTDGAYTYSGFRIARSSVFSCAQKYDDLETCVGDDEKSDPPTPTASGLIIQPSICLVSLPECAPPPALPAISQPLAHIKMSNALTGPQCHAGEEQEFEIAPGAKIVMCWIPPGQFLMGSLENELGHRENEMQHRVTITQGFWLGKYPVTQGQWEAVMGSNPCHFKGTDLPVQFVSWDDISEPGGFMEKVNHFAAGGGAFSLPTEAQWEYACRAGTVTSLNNGKNLTTAEGICPNLDEVAWYYENSENTTHPVGQKRGNAWGLHDMHGNVSEWCLDWLGAYTDEPLVDPRGPDSGTGRVRRGGSWDWVADYCRVAYRSSDSPAFSRIFYGFRITRSSGP